MRFVAILPQDIARGPTITMTRIVGHIQVATQVINAFGGSDATPVVSTPNVNMSIQLLPVIAGVTSAASIVDPFNTSDIESSRIMWWRSYCAWHGPGSTHNAVSGEAMKQVHSFNEGMIDIRTKRRFDRSRYSLVLAWTADTVTSVRWAVTFNLRGLIASTAGL